MKNSKINLKKKEVRKMKTLGIILAVALVATVYCVTAEALVVDRTVSVAASGTVTGLTSLSILPATVSYTATTTDCFPSAPKVTITYTSNYSPWKMMVYTNNTNVPNYDPVTKTGRYAKGGLATAAGVNVVPCKWVTKVGTNVTAPAVPTTASLYNFVKDKRDQDDPSTTAYDESWAAAIDPVYGGYPNIAYGSGPGAQGVCVDPTNDAAGPNQYKGDAVNGSIAAYVAGLFGTGYAGAGSYTSNIYFDLYHE